MTGYTKSEAVNRKPTFLQGEKTEATIVREIGKKLTFSTNVKADLFNYRKNGEPYICHIEIEPIFDKDDNLVKFMAFEKEI
jgi:PAS domain S-box-containing protein